MRVNPKVFTERQDMMGGIQIPNDMPKDLKVVAEKILNMITAVGYKCPNENSVTELDRILTLNYWEYYDALDLEHFTEWYIKKATEPEIISRARRWLVEHNYILLSEVVLQRATKAEQVFSIAIRGHR